VKLLIVADDARQRELEDTLTEGFSSERSAAIEVALARAAQEPFDAALVHLDLGEDRVLDFICGLRRLGGERAPGVVVLARALDRRAIVELVRTGAFDVLLESEVQPRELAHALRNAAYFARSARRRASK
jgi:DNA-binding NarL/FixJ family response regulator